VEENGNAAEKLGMTVLESGSDEALSRGEEKGD
jgi:hypothetical protein